MTVRLAIFAAAALVLATPVVAPAQDATVDPDSPSGVEYAIPVERARDEASRGGGKDEKKPGERTAPLFGEWIEPRDAEADRDEPPPVARVAQPSRRPRGGSPARRDTSLRAAAPPTKKASPAAVEAADDRVSGGVLSAVLAAVSLMVGVTVGVLIRRWRRRAS